VTSGESADNTSARTRSYTRTQSLTHAHTYTNLVVVGLVVSVTAAVESPVVFQTKCVSVYFIVKAINYTHDININSNI